MNEIVRLRADRQMEQSQWPCLIFLRSDLGSLAIDHPPFSRVFFRQDKGQFDLFELMQSCRCDQEFTFEENVHRQPVAVRQKRRHRNMRQGINTFQVQSKGDFSKPTRVHLLGGVQPTAQGERETSSLAPIQISRTFVRVCLYEDKKSA